LRTKNCMHIRFAKKDFAAFSPLEGNQWWLWERDGLGNLGSEDLKSFGAPLPLRQKHTVWIRTGNISLVTRNALNTEPGMQIWHVKMWIIEIMKSNCKNKFTTRKTCWFAVWLFANSGADSHNEDYFQKIWLGNSYEMCLQGRNLSSTRNSAIHHDLALLQQAMNAVGVCSPQKWKHEHSGMVYLATFCCRWLDNYQFYLFQLKDSCEQVF
jgi:hypothetical protein